MLVDHDVVPPHVEASPTARDELALLLRDAVRHREEGLGAGMARVRAR